MWTFETSIEVKATRETLWALFADVEGWPRWNAGIERIELRGPFQSGSSFTMQPPGMEPFISTLADVRQGESFTDVTALGDTVVRVFHGLRALEDGRMRVTYRAEVGGPEAHEIGPMVTADFADVLASLRDMAEATSQP